MTDLKPCPLCGTYHFLKEKIEDEWFYLICGQCSCNIYLYIPKGCSIDEIREIAYKQWNERVYPPEVQQAVERMKPKKPKKPPIEEAPIGRNFYRICPSCGHEIGYLDIYDFCRVCGQALDWDE